MPYSNPVGEMLAIADIYRAAPLVSADALPAYAALVREVEQQFAALPVEVIVQRENPYADHHELFADLDRGTLRVMATAEGDHPVFTPAQNDKFRAVHDYWGHYTCGVGFDRHGEYGAWVRHAEKFGALARRAMTTETRGQAALLITTGQFQAQKAFLLPAWVSTPPTR